MIEELLRGRGLDPDKILVQEAFTEPQMIYVDPEERDRQALQQLSRAGYTA